MKTDWVNYRQLLSGEIIQPGDQQLRPDEEGDEWDEIDSSRIGKPASDPLCHGHMKYRREVESAVCECQSWCQPGGKFLASHHRNCRHYDLEGDAHKIITDLLRGIEASAQDTDGVHPALWEAYKRGKASVWEFDWKESDD